jgi:hypothetical protein
LSQATRHDLRLVFANGVADSVMVGVGGHFIAAFVLVFEVERDVPSRVTGSSEGPIA